MLHFTSPGFSLFPPRLSHDYPYNSFLLVTLGNEYLVLMLYVTWLVVNFCDLNIFCIIKSKGSKACPGYSDWSWSSTKKVVLVYLLLWSPTRAGSKLPPHNWWQRCSTLQTVSGGNCVCCSNFQPFSDFFLHLVQVSCTLPSSWKVIQISSSILYCSATAIRGKSTYFKCFIAIF